MRLPLTEKIDVAVCDVEVPDGGVRNVDGAVWKRGANIREQ